MFDEKFMEDCIVEAPKAFLGAECIYIERQSSLGGFRPDLVCSVGDEIWIVEIQQRALDRTHLYKSLEYRDLLKERNGGRSIKTIVVCNSIDERYLPLARTHAVEVLVIDRAKFVDIASQHCPKSTSAFIKQNSASEKGWRKEPSTTYHFRPLGWHKHLSVFDILSHIYNECGRNNVDLDDLRNGRYWSIVNEIEDLISQDWKYSVGKIVDPTQWDIDRLISRPTQWQPEFLATTKRIRKPSLEICAEVTARGNLTVTWRPRDLKHDGYYQAADWAQWPGSGSYGWSRPANEIIYIKDVNRLYPGSVRGINNEPICNWDVLDELSVALIKAGYDWLRETLGSIVEARKITDFEFELADPSPNDFAEGKQGIRDHKRIVGWSIFDLRTREWENEQKWVAGFQQRYGIGVEQLAERYNSCLLRGKNRIASQRAKYLASELQRDGIKLSKGDVEKIVIRLQKHHGAYGELFAQ